MHPSRRSATGRTARIVHVLDQRVDPRRSIDDEEVSCIAQPRAMRSLQEHEDGNSNPGCCSRRTPTHPGTLTTKPGSRPSRTSARASGSLFKFPNGPNDYARLFAMNAGRDDGDLREISDMQVLPGGRLSMSLRGSGQDAQGEIYMMGNSPLAITVLWSDSYPRQKRTSSNHSDVRR